MSCGDQTQGQGLENYQVTATGGAGGYYQLYPQGVCPSCGRCPTCGQYRTYWYYQYPYGNLSGGIPITYTQSGLDLNTQNSQQAVGGSTAI